MFLGCLQNVSNAVAIGFGTAIACGLLVEGRIVRGAHFMAGEASGMLVGNLDMSGWDAIWCNLNGAATLIRDISNNDNNINPVPMDGITAFNLVKKGDPKALQALERFVKIAARQIYNLQLLLDPEVFIISGGIGQEMIFIDTLRQEIDALYHGMDAHNRPAKMPELCLCTFGNDANLIGVSCLLFKKLGIEL
jgi:predicted NBD/HSP70 family sugar kinase